MFKITKKLPISRFLGGTISSDKFNRIIKRFIGQQHRLQCKYLFGKEFSHVHKKMDLKRGGGRKHRIYGHNRNFILQNFRGEEKLAAYCHLLGDFVLDRFHEVLDEVLSEIKKGKIESAYYENLGDNTWDWDVKKKSIDDMIKNWGKIFIETLKNKNRIKNSYE